MNRGSHYRGTAEYTTEGGCWIARDGRSDGD